MAKIIYKEGLEGQNRLECIEGIEIELLNGQKALIYPKYSEEVMLPNDKIESWDAAVNSEIEALKKKENLWATGALLRCGSPAAEYVSNFRSDKYGIFALPTLLSAIELQDQHNDIDELAETIDGADLLRDYTSCVWSCSRYIWAGGWIANGNAGFAFGSYLSCSHLAVPLVLYR
jgi:hypothetical protein|nr:MAG TPA_asm: hypothetical protein [Caudoviricetes sp.]